jgi:putative PIN family toxin of toxin-antitoxin system
MRIVLDTSVLVAAAHSQLGASFALISQIPSKRFEFCLSLALYLEWQDVLCRPEHQSPGRTPELTLRYLRFLASQAVLTDVHFAWRPFLTDPDDDMLLELAFSAGCEHIVTHNLKDFRGSEQLGVTAISPGDFLKRIKV